MKRENRSKGPHGAQRYRVTVFATLFSVIFVVTVLLCCIRGKNHRMPTEILSQNRNIVKPLVQFHPTVEFRNGTDLIWQIPGSPKGVLFLAHGCHGRAANFWDRTPDCPKCVGLPEERLLVLHALAKEFAVITISSAGRCWTLGEERLIIKDIIKSWIEQHKLGKLPLVALGASSGGYFVSALAMDLQFSSIVLMIAEGVFDQIDVTERYPPTLFVHMPKDVYRQQKIREYMEVLRNRGVDVAEVECLDLPISPNFLVERIPRLDQTVSAELYELFREKGFIDENGYMKQDGRRTRWKEALRGREIPLDESLFPYVQEELNVAFAYHEMTSLQSEQIFTWFESHMMR